MKFSFLKHLFNQLQHFTNICRMWISVLSSVNSNITTLTCNTGITWNTISQMGSAELWQRFHLVRGKTCVRLRLRPINLLSGLHSICCAERVIYYSCLRFHLQSYLVAEVQDKKIYLTVSVENYGGWLFGINRFFLKDPNLLIKYFRKLLGKKL
jgi:hypothetical protein